jgi:hypothetical protein
MRIGVTEIKRPGSDSKETEPVIKGGGQRKRVST